MFPTIVTGLHLIQALNSSAGRVEINANGLGKLDLHFAIKFWLIYPYSNISTAETGFGDPTPAKVSLH